MSVLVPPGTSMLRDRLEATGRVLGPKALAQKSELRADVVVVGTGAGGSACFRELATAGIDVLAVEAGEFHRPEVDFNQREETMMSRLFWNQGARTNSDLTVTVTHGRGVGGSTVHNICLSENTPDSILARWRDEAGVTGWSTADMAPVFERVRATLHVSEIAPGEVNTNNALVRQGTEALGWRGRIYEHNRVGCLHCGYCVLGCAFNRKQSALITTIPAGILAGGRLAWGLHVDRVLTQAGRAVGITATVVDPRSNRALGLMTVHAAHVVLAGSSIMTPAILKQSGVADPSGLMGNTLRIHPAVPVAARFPEPVDGWRGLPQSYVTTEFADFYRGAYGGFLIIPIFAHPGTSAAMIPGIGQSMARWLKNYRYIAAATPLIHDETKGRVTVDRHGRIGLDYKLIDRDAAELRRSIRATAELFLAAGAEEVLLPYVRRTVTVKTSADLAVIDHLGVGGDQVILSSVHPQGAVPMAADAARGAADSRGQVFGTQALWVADGSLFPSSVGVPPQLSIYAAGTKVAREIIREFRG